MLALFTAWTALSLPMSRVVGTRSCQVRMADVGAASTAFYTDAVAKDFYPPMPDVLAAKCSDANLRKLMLALFDAFETVSDALRKELVVKAEEQKSVFGDVQLGVDVLADEVMLLEDRSPLLRLTNLVSIHEHHSSCGTFARVKL